MARSFTLSPPGVVRALVTSADIAAAFDPQVDPIPQSFPFAAIWDTGATGTVITQKVVDACGLKPIGMVEVHTAGGKCNSEVYLISILLPNKVGFPAVRVTKAPFLTPGIDVLIGMDIITQGDFALTHHDGKTCFSFRVPSSEKIDFVAAPGPPPQAYSKVGRNDPCPCGSGKKFKKCCGKP